KLAHLDRDMKDRLMNMKTGTDSQKRKLLDTFTNRHLEHLFYKYYGTKQRRDCAVLDEASSSQMSTSSTEMSTSSSQMSFSSMGMSSLKVTIEEFLLPYEDCDARFLNDLPDGYYPLILPQFTIMATNIMNMHADNRVNYVMKKAITVLLRINLCPEREKSYYDRINGVTVPTTIYYGDAGRVLIQESMGKKEEVRTGYKWHCIQNQMQN
ncbi:hypothetical protein BC941DRAFT_438429, partial [Chlamydoabsidia padenii]